MKKTGLIITAVFLLCGAQLFAQQKYGHINSIEIVQGMPEFKQMTDAIDKKRKGAQTKMELMYSNYQSKAKELDQFGPSMMEAVREEKMKEMDSLKLSIQAYQQSANTDMQDYRDKLLKPINDKYLKIVAEVAKEGGYAYIFDISSGGVTYHTETGDIGEQVKKKLGIN